MAAYFISVKPFGEKIQNLGLSQLYSEHDFFLSACRQLMALLFLPVAEVDHAFAFVEQTVEDNMDIWKTIACGIFSSTSITSGLTTLPSLQLFGIAKERMCAPTML